MCVYVYMYVALCFVCPGTSHRHFPRVTGIHETPICWEKRAPPLPSGLVELFHWPTRRANIPGQASQQSCQKSDQPARKQYILLYIIDFAILINKVYKKINKYKMNNWIIYILLNKTEKLELVIYIFLPR